MADSYKFSIGGGVDPSVIASINEAKKAVLDLTEGAKHIGELFGIGLGVEQVIEFGKQSIEAAVQLGKLSQETGIAVGELSKLKFAADMEDVGEHFRQGMLKFSEALADSADKSSKQAQLFSLIGVQATDTTGKLRPTEEVLLNVADKFKGWADGANKAQIAMQLFGTRNAQFISLLNQGRSGLQAYGDDLSKIGGVVKPEDIEKAEEFHKSMVELKTGLQGLAISVGAEILPSITSLVKGFTDTGVAGGKLSPIFTLVAESIKLLSIGVTVVNGLFEYFGIIIGEVAASAYEAARGHFSQAGAILKGMDKDLEASQAKYLKQIELLKNPIPRIVKAKESDTGKDQAPSIAGNKADNRDALEALREQVKAMQDAVQLRKEQLKVNFDLTTWEKQELEVNLIDQENKWLQQQIDLLKQKKNLTSDEAARGQLDKEIFRLTDQQSKLAKDRAGLTDGPQANSVSDQMRAATTQLRQQFGTVAINIADGFKNVIGSAVSSVSSGITGLIMGTKTWGQALMQIGSSILTSIVQAIVQMGVKWIATQLLMAAAGKAIMASTTAAAAPVAAAQALIWAPSATLATISTFGGAALAAPGFIGTSEAEVMAASFGGFDQGGYTGNLGRSAIAGIVHGQEYVLSAPATAQYRPLLDAMNRQELKLTSGSNSGSGSGRPTQVAFINDRQDMRQFQASDGWKVTADTLRKRGTRIV